jgi:Putative Ig domain
MAYPVWNTSAGSLGIVPENNFTEFVLSATDPGNSAVTYTVISGQTPPGMRVTAGGRLQGVPVIVNATGPQNRSYSFTVRAKNTQNRVADRTFDLTVSNVVPPQIIPRITYLGDYFDGTLVSGIQLNATRVNPSAPLTWTLTSGALPTGLSLSSSGLISGYIYPVPVSGDAGLTGYSNAPYNEFGYNNAPMYSNQNYEFTVTVFDGSNYDSFSYLFRVTAKGSWTADDDLDFVSDGYLTIDHDNIYNPVILTPAGALPSTRSNSKFAFQFSAFDANGDDILFLLTTQGTSSFDQDVPTTAAFDSTGFDQQSLSLPPGLIMDSLTGWLSGSIPVQTENSLTYQFSVSAYKASNSAYASPLISYSLTVLGDVTNTITWTTPSDLGVVDNGAVSELSVSAVSSLGKKLVYSLAPYSLRTIRNYGVTDVTAISHLPQGLKLLPTGLISGRTTFEYFSLDAGATTVDRVTTTFDDTCTFTVQAASTDGTVSSTQTFTVKLNNYNKKPYENLYLKALPTLDQRNTFLSVVNNKNIFPDNLIYRLQDPWFGRAGDIRSLALAGISPSTLSEYITAMGTNHFNKRIEFGDVRTARAVDANFNVKYEVVYVPLVDLNTYNGASPADVAYLNYTNFSGNVYPNSFKNMQSAVSSNLGYSHQGALPAWMTSPQADQKVLGFTNAIVLAYTVPGASELIAYRLRANGITFNSINFVADRYDLDNLLSKNFDIANDVYYGITFSIKGTTFDTIRRVGTTAGTVDYAVSGIPFNKINNCTLASVQALGGLDGVTRILDGQTMIFFQQENFVPATANDGWLYANGSLVTGYLEHTYNLSIPNQRAGIWRIAIDSATDIITLTFVTTVALGQKIQVNLGSTHASSIVLYDPTLKPGTGVPSYSAVNNGIASPTVFDKSYTKFIAHRDGYAVPESGDSYLKFPKTTILQ